MKYEDKVAIAIEFALDAIEDVEYLTLVEWNHGVSAGVSDEELAEIHDIILRRLKVVCKK